LITPDLGQFGGVGGHDMPAGNSIAQVQLGKADRTAPQQIDTQSIGSSVFSNRVEAQWKGVFDDANGSGLCIYEILKNSAYFQNENPGSFTFSDPAVSAGTTYTYSLSTVDCHGNYSTPTLFTVTTLAANSIEARRVGVRAMGTYWGGAGEQIDALSGNLNYTLPLLKAQGRGWGVGFALSYNSQNWRKDSGGRWKLGRDVGYGFGWQLMAGSLTPYWQISSIFIIGCLRMAAERSTGWTRLRAFRINTNGIWTSSEGIYISYDAAAQRLYFPDGSFWTMTAASAGTEEDAGSVYPMIMQDSNGNQILVRYYAGVGLTWENSSARIKEIEDVRAVRSTSITCTSFLFLENPYHENCIS